MTSPNVFTAIASSVNNSQREVAIFGLSGNPPTSCGGHAGIVHYLVQTKQFQEVWVLPVFLHQFSSKRTLAPFQTRVELCQLAFESYSTEWCSVRVLTVEEDVEAAVKRHGTIDTLNFIKDRCPQANLHLILGSDTYNDIVMGKWKQGDNLFKVATLHVIERLDTPPLLPHIQAPHIQEQHTEQVQEHRVSWLEDLSSTSLREVNPWPLWPLLCTRSPFLADPANMQPVVYEYILKHKIFCFSDSYLGAMKRSRMACLGLFCGGLLNYYMWSFKRNV